MLNNTQFVLLSAVTKLLKPLIRILLKRGIDYGTLAEIMRKAYVDVASSALNEDRLRPTTSSISAITGLTRKEVKRLRELEIADSQEAHQRYNRSTRVISGWLNDPHFLSENKQPLVLPVEGDKSSFSHLVKTYSGDIPPATMLSVLQSSNIVDVTQGQVRLLQRAYLPLDNETDKISILGTDTAELISAINHNLSCPPTERLFQRKVSTYNLSADVVTEFKTLAATKSQRLLEELDAFLSQHETNDDLGRYVALGIYYIDEKQLQQ